MRLRTAQLASPPVTSSFRTTRWSVVAAARGEPEPAARAALETLCATYWYPLYAYLRRKGQGEDQARDLVQGFFASFLEAGGTARADPAKGRFRAYLLGALRHHVSDARERERAEKRGGGRAPLPLELDLGDAEARYSLEPSDGATPERLFERRWALLVLGRALERLGEEQRARGRERVFDRLVGYLTVTGDERAYADAAEELELSEGAVKVNVHRLRARYGELIREEVGHTVERADDVEDELESLFRALSGESGEPA